WKHLIACLVQRLPAVHVIEIRPPSGVGSFQEYPGYCSRSVRRVAAVINSADCFVSADSGLMHLGSATEATTVGLFKVTDPKVYGPYGASNAGITVETDGVPLVADRIARASRISPVATRL